MRDTKRLVIEVDADLLNQFKGKCYANGISMKDAIQAYMKNPVTQPQQFPFTRERYDKLIKDVSKYLNIFRSRFEKAKNCDDITALTTIVYMAGENKLRDMFSTEPDSADDPDDMKKIIAECENNA